MAIEKCLKKQFKDSLEDIKERMKEKRNKKWAKLGKTNQVLPVKSKIADNSSTQLKSFKANNHALALALEEERSKMREAQDIILHLKKEYQNLKFQVFVLQRKLKLQQEEQAENRVKSLKKIISKVIQDLINAANIVDPGNDGCTEGFNTSHHVSEPEDCALNSAKNYGSMTLLTHDISVEINKEDKTEIEDKVNKIYSDSVSSYYEASPVLTSQAYIGCEDHLNYGESTSYEEKTQKSYSVPRSVSTRRRYLRIEKPNELSPLDNGISKVSADLCEDDKIMPNICSDKHGEKYEEIFITLENTHSINSNKVLDIQIESNATSVIGQGICNKADGSKTQKEKSHKRKLETTKNAPRTRSPKKKKRNEKVASKEKVNTSIRSNDTYDFTCGETVHITPFRQNRQNEYADVSDSTEDGGETCSGKSPISQEDSDDSLYLPYLRKSKSKKTLNCGTEVLPLCTRSQSKRTVCDQYNTNIEEIRQDIKTPKSCLDKTAKYKSSEAFQKVHLSDITNVVSTSSQRNSHPVLNTTVKDTLRQRRRSTNYVSYKEPSLSGKLRRGDPFTDTSFLNSPIFKDKAGTKSKSLDKKLVSRYNEAFVGCL